MNKGSADSVVWSWVRIRGVLLPGQVTSCHAAWAPSSAHGPHTENGAAHMRIEGRKSHRSMLGLRAPPPMAALVIRGIMHQAGWTSGTRKLGLRLSVHTQAACWCVLVGSAMQARHVLLQLNVHNRLDVHLCIAGCAGACLQTPHLPRHCRSWRHSHLWCVGLGCAAAEDRCLGPGTQCVGQAAGSLSMLWGFWCLKRSRNAGALVGFLVLTQCSSAHGMVLKALSHSARVLKALARVIAHSVLDAWRLSSHTETHIAALRHAPHPCSDPQLKLCALA